VGLTSISFLIERLVIAVAAPQCTVHNVPCIWKKTLHVPGHRVVELLINKG